MKFFVSYILRVFAILHISKLEHSMRFQSPARAHLRSALMMDDPRLMMYNRDSRGSDMPLGMRPGDDFMTDTSVDETPHLPLYMKGARPFQRYL